jgi:hypothetical protein
VREGKPAIVGCAGRDALEGFHAALLHEPVAVVVTLAVPEEEALAEEPRAVAPSAELPYATALPDAASDAVVRRRETRAEVAQWDAPGGPTGLPGLAPAVAAGTPLIAR